MVRHVKPADTRKVMRLIRRDGALTIRDIDDDVLTEKEHLWASRKPSKRALQLAFYTGVVTVSERNGMLKTYELMTRHFGWDKPPKPASASGDHGLSARPRVARAGARQPRFDLPSRRAEQAGDAPADRGAGARKEMVPVALEGAGKQEHWARPETLESAGEGASRLVHILSPFDPLIIQRKRTELFFGYGHRFEAYVPREKRLFGYFALPVLVGDEIVAALDLKTDRKNRKMLMQKWSWVGKGAARAPRKELKRRIEEELDRFERFQLAELIFPTHPLDEHPAGIGDVAPRPGRRDLQPLVQDLRDDALQGGDKMAVRSTTMPGAMPVPAKPTANTCSDS